MREKNNMLPLFHKVAFGTSFFPGTGSVFTQGLLLESDPELLANRSESFLSINAVQKNLKLSSNFSSYKIYKSVNNI